MLYYLTTENWVGKLQLSLKSDYDNYDIVFVDDASTSKTLEVANKCKESWDPPKVVLWFENNVKKRFGNLYNSVSCANPGSIIVALDGDDWLVNDSVLKHLNKFIKMTVFGLLLVLT